MKLCTEIDIETMEVRLLRGVKVCMGRKDQVEGKEMDGRILILWLRESCDYSIHMLPCRLCVFPW
jgi:hypothetical protein